MKKIRAAPKQVLSRNNCINTKIKSRTVSPKPFQGFRSLRYSKQSCETHEINPFYRQSPFINGRSDKYSQSLDNDKKSLSLPRKQLREQLIDPWREKIQKQQRQMLKNYGPQGLRVNYISTYAKFNANNDYYTLRQENPLKCYTNRRIQKKKSQKFRDSYIREPIKQTNQHRQSAYFFTTNSFFGNVDPRISKQTENILQEQKFQLSPQFKQKKSYKQSEFKKQSQLKNSSKFGSFESASRSKNDMRYSSSGFDSIRASKRLSKINIRGSTYFKIR